MSDYEDSKGYVTDEALHKWIKDDELEVTDNINEALYIMRDGTMISGTDSETGIRGLDHMCAQDIISEGNTRNLYGSGNGVEKFWQALHAKTGLIRYAPETETALIGEGQELTDEQLKALSSADYKIENYTKLADEANWLNNEGKKNRDTVARPNITKEKEEFKHKLEQYPVIVNSKHDGEANIELLHFKDRLKDLHLNLAYGSDLPSDKYKDMKISENALYVTGKQLQKPFYLGKSLEEAKITMSSDSEALDYGELYAKQYGYGILSNKQIGSTTPVYAHEEFEEVPTDEDALDYAKIYNSRTNTSRYTQDNNAERANIKSRSNTRSLITNEKHTEASLGQRQKNAIDNYYKNHKLPNGVDFVDLEKLSYNNEFRDNPWIAQDIADLINHVNTGSKYGVMFTEDNEVAIHNISKKELETISNLENYEFDPTYKTVAKDLAKVAPEAPDFSIDLGDPMSFDFNVIENDYYNPNVTDENIKKMTENIENEEKYNRQLHLKKSGLESVKLELSNPDIRKNYIEMYGNKTKLDKDTEKVFLEKPIYSQWFIQRDKAEKAYEDLEKLGFPIDYQSKESKRLDNLSRKISPATIHKLENAYVSTRNIYFDDETSEVKNVSLLSNNTKEKIERNGKKYLSQEHAKRVLKHKRLER